MCVPFCQLQLLLPCKVKTQPSVSQEDPLTKYISDSLGGEEVDSVLQDT